MKTDLCKAKYKSVVNSFTRVYLARVCFFAACLVQTKGLGP